MGIKDSLPTERNFLNFSIYFDTLLSRRKKIKFELFLLNEENTQILWAKCVHF